MKMTEELKQTIDQFFEEITIEELNSMLQKYGMRAFTQKDLLDRGSILIQAVQKRNFEDIHSLSEKIWNQGFLTAKSFATTWLTQRLNSTGKIITSEFIDDFREALEKERLR